MGMEKKKERRQEVSKGRIKDLNQPERRKESRRIKTKEYTK